MKLSTSQQQKQLPLVQMIKTMELLELNQIELKKMIEEEIISNPVIEIEKNKNLATKNKISRSKSKNYDINLFVENLSYSDWNLRAHIFEQIEFQSWTEKEKDIAELIISSLSENGFLQRKIDGKFVQIDPLELISGTNISLNEFEKVREKIKLLHPEGLACYNFYEFLLLQTELKYGKESLEFKILSGYSDLIEKRQFQKIANNLTITIDKVKEAIENISKLNITPVEKIDANINYVIPDAIVNVNNNEIEIKLAEDGLPEIKIKKDYIDMYDNPEKKEDKKFIKEYIDRANTLIENLNTRKEIVYKVILKIVEKQKKFFLNGPLNLSPLKLKDIADELNISESTVSRVVRERFIQTNRGIFPLKYFLSGSSGNEDTAKNSVKEMVKRLIENEDKNSPFTDDMIADLLKKKGVNISRRTVAKYRTELKIPSAFLRKNSL
ncbi:MAG: RNA polymerase factor sigma-54 [Brevinematales bacterium]|nr:RNA polymerase factor sigma-54 [Brevinematales bacterium]